MKHPAMLVLLLILTSTLAACGRNTDEATLPTPVAVYTRSADGVESPAQPASSETENNDALDDADTVAMEPDDSADDDSAELIEEMPAETAVAEPTATELTSDITTETETEVAETESAAVTAVAPETESEAPAEPTAEPTATPEPTAAPTPTSTPEPATSESATVAATDAGETSTATEQPDETASQESAGGEFAGVPAEVAALLPNADIARGEQLALQNACIGCHNMNPDIPMAGPTWYNMAETAATRVEGETAAAYLYNSIIHPNDYIVDGYAAGVMLQTYEDTLTPQDLADLVGYLLTLHGE